MPTADNRRSGCPPGTRAGGDFPWTPGTGRDTVKESAADSLNTSNAFFLESYAGLKSRIIDWSRNSILIVLGSEMVLLDAESEEETGGDDEDMRIAGGTTQGRVGTPKQEETVVHAAMLPRMANMSVDTRFIKSYESVTCSTLNQEGDFKIHRTAYGFQPRIYNELKTFCHVSLSLLSVFAAVNNGMPVAEAVAGKAFSQAEDLRQRTAALLRDMEANPASYDSSHIREDKICGVEDEPRESLWSANIGMIRNTLAFLEERMRGPMPTTEDIIMFIAQQKGVYKRNMKVTAYASVRSMDACLRQILAERKLRRGRRETSPKEHAVDVKLASSMRSGRSRRRGHTFHVVVIGEHMPEDGHVSKQYFLAAKGSKHEGDQVYYATSKYTDAEAVSFVAQHIADAVLSRAVFEGDAERMHRDILADDAAAAVKKLEGEGKLPVRELVADGATGDSVNGNFDLTGRLFTKETKAWRCPFR